MAFLTKKQILEVKDCPRCKVDIPEWGGEVFMRALTAREMKDIYKHATAEEGDPEKEKELLFARLVAASLENEDGSLGFTEEEILVLADKSSRVMTRLGDIAQELNGLGAEREKIAKN